MAQTKTKVMTAHVPLQMAEKIDEMAARLERSRGWVMKQALSAWIDQEEERNRLTREALADVDAGSVIGCRPERDVLSIRCPDRHGRISGECESR